jgi:hypothetical protein
MKQSDITKEIDHTLKEIGKKYDWKSKGGFLFTKKEQLFFSLIVSPDLKKEEIYDIIISKRIFFSSRACRRTYQK